ncbi:unnamed protein product, partial [Didymodactylos carnosus]
MINLTFQPAAFGYDETVPDQAAVIGWTTGSLYWFNPMNLAFIRNSSIWTSLSLSLHNNSIFTGLDSHPAINVFDSQTNNQIINISHASLTQTR